MKANGSASNARNSTRSGEPPANPLAESQLALAALASLCAGERDAIEVLRRLLRRVRPSHVPRVAG